MGPAFLRKWAFNSLLVFTALIVGSLTGSVKNSRTPMSIKEVWEQLAINPWGYIVISLLVGLIMCYIFRNKKRSDF